jgi:predicted nucleic acid-binding Zn ribbon protein
MIFEYVCHECELIWQRECRVGKAPGRTRCPECKKLSERFFGSMPAVHFKGTDFWTVRNQIRKSRLNKQDINEFYEGANKASEKRMGTGWQHYSRMDINPDYFVENGLATVKTGKEHMNKQKLGKDLGYKLRDKHKK